MFSWDTELSDKLMGTERKARVWRKLEFTERQSCHYLVTLVFKGSLMTVQQARKEAAKYEIKFRPISYSISSNQRAG